MPARRKYNREHVAAIVMEAIELGLPIVSTVMEVLAATENQARHMVRMARQEGHLGAGAHKPARATIHRGSDSEKTWTVCEDCTTNWPCADAFPNTPPETIESHDPHDARERPAGRRRRAAARRPRVDAG